MVFLFCASFIHLLWLLFFPEKFIIITYIAVHVHWSSWPTLQLDKSVPALEAPRDPDTRQWGVCVKGAMALQELRINPDRHHNRVGEHLPSYEMGVAVARGINGEMID